MLFAYTLRAYEGKTKEFLTSLKEKRLKINEEMGAYKLPEIQVAN